MEVSQYSAESAVISSSMILLCFSVSRRDESAASPSRSRMQNRPRRTSMSSDSSGTSPAKHRQKRYSPVEVTWVPAETNKPHLSHFVGSSKFSASRSFDDSRVNPERKRNLSDDAEVFGPTLPPLEGTKKQSSKTDASDTQTNSRQRQTTKETPASTGKKVSRTDERRHSSQKIKKSRETSSTSRSPRRSSRSQSSSSSTSSSPVSKTKKKLSQSKSKSSVSVSGSRRTRRSRSSSSRSSSGTKKKRKRVRQSTSSGSSSSSTRSRSEPRGIKSTDKRSRKDRFQAQNDHRREKQSSKRDFFAGHERRALMAKDRRNLSFSSGRKSRSGSRDRSGKRMAIHRANWTSHKYENFDQRSQKTNNHKEPGSAAKSDVKNMHTETGVKRLADYSSSSDDERTKASQSKAGIFRKAPTVDRETVDSKKAISGRPHDTPVNVVADSGKGADSKKAKTDDKPKETLEDMELFLKQLKANKQQQMLKKQ